MISKLLRLYKRNYGLRQIPNIAVYIAHLACTIHLLNLPDKNARRDIVHGVKHLEEIADNWLCARRTLSILNLLVRRWKVELPEEAAAVLERTGARFSNPYDYYSPKTETSSPGSFSKATLANIPRADLTYQLSNNSYVPTTASTVSNLAADEPLTRGISPMPLPPPITTDFNPVATNSRYTMPPSQRELWDRDRSSRRTTQPVQTSPSVLFGGVDSLMEESQDWWLKDQSALAMGFGNWNDVLTDEATLLGNGNDLGGRMDNGNGFGNDGRSNNQVCHGLRNENGGAPRNNGINNGNGNGNGNEKRNGRSNVNGDVRNGLDGYLGYGNSSYGYNHGDMY